MFCLKWAIMDLGVGRFYFITKFISTRSYCLGAVTKPSFCVSPSADQRVSSFCTLTDMHHRQGLEGAQELPLCVDPGSGKDFLDTTGYVSPYGPPPSAAQSPCD